MSTGDVYLAIEHGGTRDGQRVRIPRGWVILTLLMASWGVASIVGLVIWGLFAVPLLNVLGTAVVLIGLVAALWFWRGRHIFVVWAEKLVEDDER